MGGFCIVLDASSIYLDDHGFFPLPYSVNVVNYIDEFSNFNPTVTFRVVSGLLHMVSPSRQLGFLHGASELQERVFKESWAKATRLLTTQPQKSQTQFSHLLLVKLVNKATQPKGRVNSHHLSTRWVVVKNLSPSLIYHSFLALSLASYHTLLVVFFFYITVYLIFEVGWDICHFRSVYHIHQISSPSALDLSSDIISLTFQKEIRPPF